MSRKARIARARHSALGRMLCRIAGDKTGAVMMEYVILGVLMMVAWAFPDQPPSQGPHSRRRFAGGWTVAGLIAVSWALQWAMLRSQIGYPIGSRLDLASLLAANDYASAKLGPQELRFARCLANSLPIDFPVTSGGPQSPVFHRQNLAFAGLENRLRTPSKLRVIWSAEEPPAVLPNGFRIRLGRLTVEGEADLANLAEACRKPREARAPATLSRGALPSRLQTSVMR